MEDIIIIVVIIVLLGIMLLVTFGWNDSIGIDTTLNHTQFEYEHIRMQRELEYQSLLMQYQDTRDRYLRVHEEYLPTNCKNCGAPLKSHKCEYCGTKY